MPSSVQSQSDIVTAGCSENDLFTGVSMAISGHSILVANTVSMEIISYAKARTSIFDV